MRSILSHKVLQQISSVKCINNLTAGFCLLVEFVGVAHMHVSVCVIESDVMKKPFAFLLFGNA